MLAVLRVADDPSGAFVAAFLVPMLRVCKLTGPIKKRCAV